MHMNIGLVRSKRVGQSDTELAPSACIFPSASRRWLMAELLAFLLITRSKGTAHCDMQIFHSDTHIHTRLSSSMYLPFSCLIFDGSHFDIIELYWYEHKTPSKTLFIPFEFWFEWLSTTGNVEAMYK